MQAEPIRETIDHLRDALAWMGEPVVKQKKHNNTLVFKVQPTFTASHLPTYKEFVMNMEEKLQDEEFLADTEMILGPGVEYDASVAWKKVHDELVSRLMRPEDRRRLKC